MTKASLEKSKQDYENITADLKKIDEELDELRNTRSTTSITLQEITSHIEILKEQINSENKNNENLASRGENIDSDIEKSKKSLINLKRKRILYKGLFK